MKAPWTPLCTAVAAVFVAFGTPAMASGLVIGTGGHDAWSSPVWQAYNAEAAFQLLNARNMRTYRVDVSNNAQSYAALTKLVALGKKYNIAIRPMLYVDSGLASDAYTIARMFAPDIHIWELGNELNLRGVSNFTASINLMIQARIGIMQAAAATGQPLQTAINVTAAYGATGLSVTAPTYPFIDQAISMGLAFDYITFHYYPSQTDRAAGWMKKYLDPLRKYGKLVLLNETNCAQIYSGDNGNSAACGQTVNDILTVVQNDYGDMIPELDFYEIIDDPEFSTCEGHFGINFDLTHPKVSIGLATQHAVWSTAVPTPIVPNTYMLTNAQYAAELVAATYNRVLQPGGLNFYTNWLTSNAANGRATLIANAVNSAEFQKKSGLMDNQAYVARLFLAILGRPVDMTALTFYGGALDSNQMARSQVVQTLFSSAEFLARHL